MTIFQTQDLSATSIFRMTASQTCVSDKNKAYCEKLTSEERIQRSSSRYQEVQYCTFCQHLNSHIHLKLLRSGIAFHDILHIGDNWLPGQENWFCPKINSLEMTHNYGQFLGYLHFEMRWASNCWNYQTQCSSPYLL